MLDKGADSSCGQHAGEADSITSWAGQRKLATGEAWIRFGLEVVFVK